MTIERGEVQSSGGEFTVPGTLLEPETDTDLVIPAPHTGRPPWRVCKSSAGLFSEDPMDLVDLFVGSEGILGIIVNVRTVLLPMCNPRFSLMLYVPDARVTVEMVGLLDMFRGFFREHHSHLKDDIEDSLHRLTGELQENWQERFSRVIPCCMEWFGSSVAPLSFPRTGPKAQGRVRCAVCGSGIPGR